jgi:hypothetical protein
MPPEEKQDKIILYDMLIFEKISEAHSLFKLWGEALEKDPHIVSLLNSLDKKIADSWKAMEAFGVGSACSHCSEEDGDTCCGAGIENRYTARLLLINLLLGNAFPEKRFRTNGCFFLSEKGCSLKARLVLCVNYLCSKIQGMGSPEELARLQTITGQEMDEGFLLDEAVKKFITV